MLTQCPTCDTTFRVTSEILRVAQGQVRCGRCHTQFDALHRLVDERAHARAGGRTPAQPGEPVDESRSDIEVGEPVDHEDITLEGKHIEISGTYAVLDELDADGEPQVRQEIVEQWADIEDPDTDDATDADTDAENGDPYALDESTTGEAAADGLAVDEEGSADDAATDDPPDQAPLRADRSQRERGADEALEDLPFARRRSAARLPLFWKILPAPLALLLIVQLLHHHRAELARHPRYGAPLMSVYRTLGLSLQPDWNLHAYDIKQWGVISDAAIPGALLVRASIENRAAFPQPYPLLRLVLEDRWGDQVSAREFEPIEYLDAGSAPERLLQPNRPHNATITIVDPGPDAEGFRFDVCLRGSAGAVCAGDVPE